MSPVANIILQTVEHAGFQRDIISQNPPLVDEDGYQVDSDEDNERAEAAIASAAEFDPYSDVKIERMDIYIYMRFLF
jgi:hypothetical protein